MIVSNKDRNDKRFRTTHKRTQVYKNHVTPSGIAANVRPSGLPEKNLTNPETIFEDCDAENYHSIIMRSKTDISACILRNRIAILDKNLYIRFIDVSNDIFKPWQSKNQFKLTDNTIEEFYFINYENLLLLSRKKNDIYITGIEKLINDKNSGSNDSKKNDSGSDQVKLVARNSTKIYS